MSSQWHDSISASRATPSRAMSAAGTRAFGHRPVEGRVLSPPWSQASVASAPGPTMPWSKAKTPCQNSVLMFFFCQVGPDASENRERGCGAAGLHLGLGTLGSHRAGQWRQGILAHHHCVPPLHGEEGSGFRVALGWHCAVTSAAAFRSRPDRFRRDGEEPAYVLPVGLRLGERPTNRISPAVIQPPVGHQGGKVHRWQGGQRQPCAADEVRGFVEPSLLRPSLESVPLLELPQAVASEVAEGRGNAGPWLTLGFGPMAWRLVPHFLEQREHATFVPPLPHVERVPHSRDHRRMGVGSSWFGSVCQAQPLEPGWQLTLRTATTCQHVT